MSHKASHSKKCNPLQNPSLSTVPRSTPDAVSDAIPSLSDVCELRCSTIRFISTKAKPALSRASLRAVVSDNSVESLSKLFLLPKCVHFLPCEGLWTIYACNCADSEPAIWSLFCTVMSQYSAIVYCY